MTSEREEPTEKPVQRDPGRSPKASAAKEPPERTTRRSPAPTSAKQRASHDGRSTVPREELADLIVALGDTSHPRHASAVNDLVALGPVAVPAICDALGPNKSWLTVYRAAEAAGRLGDGRTSGPLIQALQHPNSNVRWSIVQALGQVSDMRAMLELRRVARTDQGRTTWGESVAETAQSVLDELGRRSVWGQGLELIKTAVVAGLMIVALILSFSVITSLRAELERFGRFIPGETEFPQFTLPTALPTTTTDSTAAGSGYVVPQPTTLAQPTVEPVLGPTALPNLATELTGTVLQEANVRPVPNTDNQPIGRVSPGDEIIFLARTANSQWYLIRLADDAVSGSTINSLDGTGWISQALVSAPTGDLEVRQVDLSAPIPDANP
ncbi:HEAT repeat domain-containing protein [Candidatus Chloroploca sp. M-50]|uniref:HEAT repeat domain-containing protein n=1 Tax=Candidatus Chloroploca mongolica TaxID=2528176 RepID=A0ABS4DCI1_9CHLR|nr:HEAT repeat domain-containing protein [Candidatus Chloroploca mongolica]MBP1467143.1 HEAT repeat domain-containing protein [Candidatus Chloroploca mongolica]